MKSLVLSTVYLDFVRGARSFAMYFEALYVAVPMFDMIGRIPDTEYRIVYTGTKLSKQFSH